VARLNVRCWENSGKHLLAARILPFDPLAEVAFDERSQKNPFEVSHRFARKSVLDFVVLHRIPPAKEVKTMLCCGWSDSAKLFVFA
jgi:hypothetical protein